MTTPTDFELEFPHVVKIVADGVTIVKTNTRSPILNDDTLVEFLEELIEMIKAPVVAETENL